MIIAQELRKSAVAALDEFYQVQCLQELIEISLEQLEQATQTPEQRRARTGLLITSYLHQVGPYLDRVNASKSSSQITPNWLKKLQFIPTLSLTILQNLSNICRCWYWSSLRHSLLVGRHLPN